MVVFDCPCGKKFVKSRGEDQTECLFCIQEKVLGRPLVDLRDNENPVKEGQVFGNEGW